MVNYVCRTCLYVGDNEFSFRRLEKVKEILQLFVPEIKTFVGKYSLICDQCYYFLKNVEKFKTKCIETQKKLVSMNIETIKDKHDAVLKSVANEVPLKGQHQREAQLNLEAANQSRLKRSIEGSTIKACKRSKQDFVSVTSTVTSENEITLTNLLNSSEKPFSLSQKQPNQRNIVTPSNTSVGDDLLQLFNSDISDLTSFREFAVKDANSPEKSGETSSNTASKKNNNEPVINYEDDEEYMTKDDLVSAGILSDDSNKSADVVRQTESASENEPEIVEIELSDNSRSSEGNTGTVEFKLLEKSKTNKKHKKEIPNETSEEANSTADTVPKPIPMTATVKKEIPEDENPGLSANLQINLSKVTAQKIESTIEKLVKNQKDNIKEQLCNGQEPVQSCKSASCEFKDELIKRLEDEIFKPIRGSWNEDQKSVMLEYFDNHIIERRAPKKQECVKLKREKPDLFKDKTWVQIKVFIYNTYKQQSIF